MADAATATDDITLIELTAGLVAAYVGHNALSVGDVGKLLTDVHTTLKQLKNPAAVQAEAIALVPAVAIRKSVTPDFLISLEDGKKYKSLKRHLRTKYDLSPEDYRAKWGLPSDYPMVAPNYAQRRSELAKSNGLGRKPGEKPAPVVAAKPGRKSTKAALATA